MSDHHDPQGGRPPGRRPQPGPYPAGYPYPGGYPQQPPYPGGYPQQPPYPGGYPQQPPYPGGHPQPAPYHVQQPPWYGPWPPPPGYVPQWDQASRRQMPLPSFPHPEPREYHQMLRTWNYAWWKPVVGIVLALLGMVVVAPLVLMPVLAAGVAIEGGPFVEKFEKAASLDSVDPAGLLYLNLVLGASILVAWFVMRVVHRMRPRWLASVMPKLRWKFLFACLGLAVVALLAQVAVSGLLPGQQEGDVGGKLNDFTATTVALVLVVLFTTPLQAAGEEYIFRGYLLQAVGSLFRVKWVAILLTATFFALAHGVQNFPLFFDRFMFGLIAGWLVTRTGGLEAGIALHILNNFLAFGFAIAFGNLTDTLNVSEVGWWNIVLTVTQSGVYAVLVTLLAKKMGLQTRTRPPAPPPAAEPRYDAAPVPSGA